MEKYSSCLYVIFDISTKEIFEILFTENDVKTLLYGPYEGCGWLGINIDSFPDVIKANGFWFSSKDQYGVEC